MNSTKKCNYCGVQKTVSKASIKCPIDNRFDKLTSCASAKLVIYSNE